MSEILKSLLKLHATAERQTDACGRSAFVDGYLTGVRHAIELVELHQLRLDVGLAIERGEP